MSDQEDEGSRHFDLDDTTIRFAGRRFTASRLLLGGALLVAGAVSLFAAISGWEPGYFGAVVLGVFGVMQILSG